jgi:hypothetical protein
LMCLNLEGGDLRLCSVPRASVFERGKTQIAT